MKNTPQNDQSNQQEQRRDFLKKSTIALGALTFMPGHILFGKEAVRNEKGELLRRASFVPSEKVNLACCGIGHRGRGVVNALYETGLANIVALCDVDMGAPHTADIIKKFPDVPRFQDFRCPFFHDLF